MNTYTKAPSTWKDMVKKCTGLFIVAAILTTAMHLCFPLQSHAYNLNTSYVDKLDGTPVNDFIAVAKAQVGRSEKTLGFSGGWCARFVWNMAKVAGIPSSIIPQDEDYSGCDELFKKMVNDCGAEIVSTPTKGDLVFYTGQDPKNYPDKRKIKYIHVAIMSDSNYSIHGNYKKNGVYQVVHVKKDAFYAKPETRTYAKIVYLRPNYKQITPSVPDSPKSLSLSATEFAIGDSLTVHWPQVSKSMLYHVVLQGQNDTSISKKISTAKTTATFSLDTPGLYTISVTAENGTGSSPAVVSDPILVHDNVEVVFQDDDSSLLCSPQYIKWNGTATAPYSPEKEGYTFQGWDKSLYNIKENTVITATYRINTYTVRFVDAEGNQLSTQKISHGNAATQPSPPTAPTGYIFSGWDNDEWRNVTADTTVTAVFSWQHEQLPIYVTIHQATRNVEASGYHISFTLTNTPEGFTKGKIIAALKTQQGKMVASETQNFYLNADTSETKNIYIDYSGVATFVEIFTVGIIDNGNTGVPLAELATQSIDLGNSWSDWNEEKPISDNYEIESRTEYRYRNKEKTESASDNLDEWIPDGYKITSWGAWSSWSKTAITATEGREVEASVVDATYQTRYKYDRSVNNAGTMSTYDTDYYPNYQSIDLSYKLSAKGTTSGHTYYGSYTGNYGSYLKNYWWNEKSYRKKLTDAYTQYRYRDAVYTYYFYRWSDWSDWSTNSIEATDDREVETRTVYRFKSKQSNVNFPIYHYKRFVYFNSDSGITCTSYTDQVAYTGEWAYLNVYDELELLGSETAEDGTIISVYNQNGEHWYRADVNDSGDATVYITQGTLEDTSGKIFPLSTQINAAGKNAVLMVYKGTNTDPTASQLEYVEQIVLDETGSYSFDISPKEIPSTKTGDFIIILGIEGSTAPFYLDTIFAPKPHYQVKFTDFDGNVLTTQSIEAGGHATVPKTVPEKEGYEFIGWDSGTKNITCDMIIQALYNPKEYTVVFTDHQGAVLEMKTFLYSSPLIGPTPDEIDGYTFLGWDAVLNGTTTVTKNMLVSAVYQINTYTVTYACSDGTILGVETANYGEEVPQPEEIPTYENMIFDGWSDKDAVYFASKDTTVYPVFAYTENTQSPTADIASGTYVGEKIISLSCATDNSTIYYTVTKQEPENTVDDVDTTTIDEPSENESGTEDDIEWITYTEPIVLAENCHLQFYATAENMNKTGVYTCDYTILGSFSLNITGSTLKNTNGVVSGKIFYNTVGAQIATSAKLVTAVYNEQGILMYVRQSDTSEWNTGDNPGSMEVSFPADDGQYTIKLFLWNTENTIMPVSNAESFNFK